MPLNLNIVESTQLSRVVIAGHNFATELKARFIRRQYEVIMQFIRKDGVALKKLLKPHSF